MITPSLYQSISDDIDEILYHRSESFRYGNIIYNNVTSIEDQGCSMEETISIVNALTDKLFYRNSGIYISALLTSLQNHILTRTEYDDINEFLSDNSILVGSDFARLSDDLGYSINQENIR